MEDEIPLETRPKELPNYYAQVFKMMESAERRFLSKPDLPESYNNQIKLNGSYEVL